MKRWTLPADIAEYPAPPDYSTPCRRPSGGRPNPCAMAASESRRPILVRKGRSRIETIDTTPDYAETVCRAVIDGRLPVGLPLTRPEIMQMAGIGICEMSMLSMRLIERRLPVRLRRAALRNTWTVSLP